MTLNYILDANHKPVPEPDFIKWALWFQNEDNIIVVQNEVQGCFVSTVFLGVDHNFHRHGPPILFETMIFRDHKPAGYQQRCSTWDEALVMHARGIAAAWELAGEKAQ